MAIRVKVRLKFSNNQEIVTSALANAGYEGNKPEVVLPSGLAKQVDLFNKNLPKVSFETAGGYVKFYELHGFVDIQVLTKDKNSKVIKCKAVISEYEDEVIINDQSIGALEIELVNVAKCIWKFSGETKKRPGENPQSW